jgi:uncharacterized protein (TIGR03437 family)
MSISSLGERTRLIRLPEMRDGQSRRLLTWLLCSAAWLPAQAQIPTINPNGLVNAATGRSASSIPVAARGSIVSIYGNNLASATLTANGFPLPKDLGGVQVVFGGLPAALLYVSPSQIDAQVPFELPDVSVVDLVVQNGNASSAALSVTLLAQDPGIFKVIASGALVSPMNPVFAGESITIWANGLGAVLPAVPSGQPGPSNPPAVVAITPVVKLGGLQVNVDFAGLAPGQVIYQINATAPVDLAAPTSEVTVEVGVIPAVTGPPGPIGPPGTTGTAGSPGPSGATGPSGTNGVNGSPGAPGTNGANGLPGIAGIAGPRGLFWRGAWSNTTAYAVNDAVQFDGTSYISIQAGMGHQPVTTPTFWSLLAQQGTPGTDGTNGVNGLPGAAGTNGVNGLPGVPGLIGPPGLTWRGTWSNAMAYAVNDATQFNETSYVSIQAGMGNEPGPSSAFWSVLALAGAAGAPGTNGVNGSPGAAGTNGVNGSPGAAGTNGTPGLIGPPGLTWRGTWSNTTAYAVNDATQFNGTSYISIQAGTGNAPGPSSAFWSVLAQKGAPGANGTIAFADFYALMPSDNSSTVAPGSDVSFPQYGPTSVGSITPVTASTFNLATIGTYQVMFQVSVDEAGQLDLSLNGAELANTVVGRATGTVQIVGMSLVTTTLINSVLTVRNPSANTNALTISTSAGGTLPVSAHLVITQIQ